MNDLISRSALLAKMKRTYRYFDVKFDIEEMPAVDAVEVVRCRECINRNEFGECRILKRGNRAKWFCVVDDDDFCRYGERRNGDD